jgi:hypothetical protein
MSGPAGHDEADGGSRWPEHPPADEAPFWIPRQQDAEPPAWDEPGRWFRDEPAVTGSGPPRSRRKLAVVGGIGVAGVVGLAAVLMLTGVFGSDKATVPPGFHPTAAQPALAARQTAEAFLTAWKSGHLRKAASYTNKPSAAAAALTSYDEGLNLRALQLAVRSTTAKGTVAFSVDATVGLPAPPVSGAAGQSAASGPGAGGSNPAVTAAWSYTSHLTAYAKDGGWWVRWNPALVAPNLTASEKVMSSAIPPGAGEVVDAAGNNLADSSDPGVDHLAAALKSSAPAGQGTPGIEVEPVGPGNVPIGSPPGWSKPPSAPPWKQRRSRRSRLIQTARWW